MSTLLQFVQAIDPLPTVRLNLNDGATWSGPLQGSDFSPPPMTYAVADTILTDGATVAASAYDNRTLKITLDLVAANADAKATALRALHAELNRPNNILEYKPGTTPLFFRTFRSPHYTLTEFPTDGYTQVELEIEAEPFAYGLRFDQSGVTVKADPSLTNGCYVDMNGVTGDVETPAYVTLSFGSSAATTVGSILAVRRHGIPANLTHAYQAEAMTMGTNTTVTGPDATASGGGGVTSNTATTTFGTANALRLTFTMADLTEARGTFRIYARVKKTVSGDNIQILNATNGWTTVGAGTNWQMIDLGLLQVPGASDSAIGYSGAYPTLVSPDIKLWANRVAGTGNLIWDYVLMIPADENFTVFQGTSGYNWSTTGGLSLILDGPNDTAYYLNGTAISGLPSPVARSGSIPQLRPGNNRLYFVENLGTATVSDQTTVIVSYWPRYLVV